MRSMILAIAATAPMVLSGFGAEAMPASPVAGATVAPEVTLIGGGCGPGWHPNPRGICVQNFYRPYAVVRPAYVYRPYARCGIRVGPIGIGAPC